MSTNQRSTTLYPHPFSKAYWRDAASELKSLKMLVVTALLIALRVALKPLAIPLGNPQLCIQTAMLATALGAMIFGPVVAIPAAIISDTIGFMIFPNGDYFLPFVLTEIASTMVYSLCLYRSKVSATRVMLARFLICFVVNMILQTLIIAWQYTYMGNPESAKNQILGIFTVSRLFKNLFFFPIESVVMTLFLKALIPITYRAKLTFEKNANLSFTKKQIAILVLLVVVGIGSAVGYLTYYYNNNSVTKDYTAEEVVERNKAMHAIILEQDDSVSEGDTVAVIEYAAKPFFGKETTYTVALYQAVEGAEITDKMWSYKKTPASKDENLMRLATVTIVAENKTDAVVSFQLKLAETGK
ncbi:MAG: folate family ECF transporter S component [Oscillospiraceae bacterium]|nr:folate family ECF transporter S component [Oscillospiraceae bacterium]